jgi:DNA primase
MRKLPDSFLEQLQSAADIVSLAQGVMKLQHSGRTLRGLCPFHLEKTPSFHIYPETNSFYCFGCGAGGGVVQFVMRLERLDFLDAVKWLCDRFGLQFPQEEADDTISKQRVRILEANRLAARFYHNMLSAPAGQAGLSYWHSRKIEPETLKRFGLGYAPDSWDALQNHLCAQGFSKDELVQANLSVKREKDGRTRYYDTFRGRVIVPILDIRGNVVAFGARTLGDGKPKYINTADTLAYKKGQDVFALHTAKQSTEKKLLLCEGYMDVIALHQAGWTNAVACLGTAFTAEQATLLARYAVEVALCYDADAAGQAAAKRALGVLSKTRLKIRVLELKGGKDPDEILRKGGKEAFRKIYAGAANAIEFRLLQARGSLDLSTPDGKLEYLREAAQILAREDAGARDVYAGKLAHELDVEKTSVLMQISLFRKKEDKSWEKAFFSEKIRADNALILKADPARAPHLAAEKAETRVLGLLQLHPDLWHKLRDILTEDLFVTPLNRQLFHVLSHTLAANTDPGTVYSSGAVTPAQAAELMRQRLAAQTADGNPLVVCRDCVKRLKEEKAAAALQNLRGDDEIRAHFHALQTKHNTGG